MKNILPSLIFTLLISVEGYSQKLFLTGEKNKTIETYKVGDELFFRFNTRKTVIIGNEAKDTTLQISAMGFIKELGQDFIVLENYTYANYILNGKHLFNNMSPNSFELLEIPTKIPLKDIGVIQIKKRKILVNKNMIVEEGKFKIGKIKIL